MRYSNTLFATIVSALLVLSSCVKPKVKTFEPEYAIPIANGRLEVIDLLAADTSELVTVDGEGLVAIKYEGGVVRLKGSDFISIPNTESQVEIGSPLVLTPTTFPQGETQSFSGTQSQQFNINGLDITKLSTSGGLFRVVVGSTFSNDVRVDVNVPQAVKNGQPLSVSVNIPSNTANREIGLKLTSLAGYTFNFGANNELGFDYNVTITSRGNGVDLTDSVDVKFSFENVEFERIDFIPSNLEFDVPRDSIDLEIFKNSSSFADIIDFGFFNPTVGLTFENGYGIDAEILIEEFKAGDANPANDEAITGVPASIAIPRASANGDVQVTSFEVNKDNSNIEDVLNPTDRYVKYNFKMRTAAGAQPSFITSESTFGVRAQLNLPLQGYSEGWTLTDTLDIDLSAVDLGAVKSGSVLINLRNQFPFEMDIQLYVLGNNNQIVDSLIKGDVTLLPSGQIDPNNGRSTIAESIRNIVLDELLLERMSNAQSFILKAGIRTAGANDNPPKQVAIYDDYFMDVAIGIKAKISTESLGSDD